ncbi:GyrI-like domain-containing protein [Sediminibacillus dalangtanensis]|uniref:GyrI-like domain-containing protein n=1 Tax=Sediminibacillus dalangtanensis TaxID=2729421 RepID=UPI001FD83B37|nr:GyrI-like domain-containing protein [Sediminibacillus dalangtanensis]
MKESYKLLEVPGYRAVGLKWEGAYKDIDQLKQTIRRMNERVGELDKAVEPDVQLGLSYHLRPDGFVHYSAYKVSEEQQVPKGMVEIRIPAMTCLYTEHQKGQSIGETYWKLNHWLESSSYRPFKEKGVDYYDDLPIKHERYPADRDEENPHFAILIPVINRDEKKA